MIMKLTSRTDVMMPLVVGANQRSWTTGVAITVIVTVTWVVGLGVLDSYALIFSWYVSAKPCNGDPAVINPVRLFKTNRPVVTQNKEINKQVLHEFHYHYQYLTA